MASCSTSSNLEMFTSKNKYYFVSTHRLPYGNFSARLLGVMLRETGTKGHVHLIKLIREVKQKQQQQQQQQQRPPPAIKKSPKQQQQQQLHPKTPRPRRRKRRRKRKKRRMPESVFRELHEHFFHGDPQDLFQIPVLQEYDAGGNKVKVKIGNKQNGILC